MKNVLIALSFLALTSQSIAQESILRDFAESRRKAGWLYPICLYPSTLRMISLDQDPEFYKLVNEIEKVLIYKLDSATIVAAKNSQWMDEYEAKGYEEYVSISGPQTLKIIGKGNEYVGMAASEEQVVALYMRGQVGFASLPRLVNTFSSDNLLSILKDQFE